MFEARGRRWTSKDPIRFTGGLNLYGYERRPGQLIDPSGLDPYSGDAMMESRMLAEGIMSPAEAQQADIGRGVGVLMGFMGWLASPEIAALGRMLGLA